MEVTQITVRRLRRVQLREYEPAENEVTVTAQLTEGEDWEKVTETLLAGITETIDRNFEGGSKPAKKAARKTKKTKPTQVEVKDLPGLDEDGDERQTIALAVETTTNDALDDIMGEPEPKDPVVTDDGVTEAAKAAVAKIGSPRVKECIHAQGVARLLEMDNTKRVAFLRALKEAGA